MTSQEFPLRKEIGCPSCPGCRELRTPRRDQSGVALELRELDASGGRFSRGCPVLLLRPIRDQIGIEGGGGIPRLEFVEESDRRSSIPRADFLADVAADDPAAHLPGER